MTEYLTLQGLEVRDSDGSDGRTVIGLAVPFGEQAIGPKGPEVVIPGAFRRTLDHWRKSGRTMKALRNHDPAHPVAQVTSIAEDPTGLKVELRMADTQLGDETLREVRANMLDSFSIGFTANRERQRNGIRELLEVTLHEVSLVSLPAYAGARVAEVRTQPDIDYSRYRIPELPVSLLADVTHLR